MKQSTIRVLSTALHGSRAWFGGCEDTSDWGTEEIACEDELAIRFVSCSFIVCWDQKFVVPSTSYVLELGPLLGATTVLTWKTGGRGAILHLESHCIVNCSWSVRPEDLGQQAVSRRYRGIRRSLPLPGQQGVRGLYQVSTSHFGPLVTRFDGERPFRMGNQILFEIGPSCVEKRDCSS